LSQDEIVFDEIRYREPLRMRRPDRDRQWACLAYEVPAPDDLPIFLDRATADAIERHALRDTSVELGGILLGKECIDDLTGALFVWVTKSLEAKHYENTQASFTYTHDSWEEITRERDQKHPDLDIVGWYHTHPDFGVFLSSHDMFIHRHFFAQPLQLAYVVDPIRQTRGFFRWRGGEMEQTGGFYLTADRGDRIALARLANDLENFPNASDGGVGGLSPRLEAELIAMLTRPAVQYSGGSSADRTQNAMLFGLLGAMLGVLGLAAVLWLNALNVNIAEQGRALDDVRKSINETSDRQRILFDTALGEAGGTNPERFVKDYARATRERDDAKRQYLNQVAINDLVAGKFKQAAEDLATLQAKYDDIKQYEKDAKETAALRLRFDDLRGASERQTRKIAELEDLLDTPEGRKAIALAQKYQNTWYACIAGWSVSAVLALTLLGGYAYLKLPPEEVDEPTPRAGEGPPPHRIT
jgi:proteasome lid subunit RPN8/RPN11